MTRAGVLLTGFGGPDSLDAVRPFMCNLMGREPAEELVERVCRRYLAIGGASPLNAIARSIAARLEEMLASAGHEVPVAVGMRYWSPFIADALSSLVEAGCDRIVTVSLSPFETKVAHGAYRDALATAADGLRDIEFVEAPLVSELDEFAHFYAMSAAATLNEVEHNEGLVLAFTAHSLPESDLVDDDPYIAGLRRTADAVAERLGLDPGAEAMGPPLFEGFISYGSIAPPRPWFLVFQSKGNKPGEWLGPDIGDLVDAVKRSGAHGLVAVPIGFLTDHMETLYDLDIVAAGRALDAGIEFFRAPTPNDDDAVIEAVARSVIERL